MEARAGVPVIQCLLEAGADPKAQDVTGQNILHIVARRCVDSIYVTQLVALFCLRDRKRRDQLSELLSARNHAGHRPV